MKKILIIAILTILLIACGGEVAEEPSIEDELEMEAPAEEQPPAAAEEEVEAQPEAPAEETETQVEETPAAPTPAEIIIEQNSELDPELRDLLRRADEKLTSLEYLYGGTETGNLFLNTYKVKGEKIRIDKYEEDYYVKEGHYTHVYVNEAIGCCQKLNRCRSHNVDNTDKVFEVDVESLNIPRTPYQWVKEIETARILGPQVFDERTVTQVEATLKDGTKAEMLVDTTYGVPHRVVIKDVNGNDIKYQFNDLKFNTMDDEEFVPPCKEE